MRCFSCGEDWTSTFCNEGEEIDLSCVHCTAKKFFTMMTLAGIDFEKIEEEVNGNV